jgi:hypothetical protein
MTKPTLRSQREAVFAAIWRAKVTPADSLALTPDAKAEYMSHLTAASETLRWLEKHEATVRAAVAKKTGVAGI